jgi:hypothetical protein
MQGKSFNLFELENSFRQNAFFLVEHKYFDYFIMVIIVLSAIQLAMENPL